MTDFGSPKSSHAVHGDPTWTKTPPTEPGWYWVKIDDEERDIAELWVYCGEERWSGAYLGQGRTLDGIRRDYPEIEFWPVRIEEPPV